MRVLTITKLKMAPVFDVPEKEVVLTLQKMLSTPHLLVRKSHCLIHQTAGCQFQHKIYAIAPYTPVDPESALKCLTNDLKCRQLLYNLLGALQYLKLRHVNTFCTHYDSFVWITITV